MLLKCFKLIFKVHNKTSIYFYIDFKVKVRKFQYLKFLDFSFAHPLHKVKNRGFQCSQNCIFLEVQFLNFSCITSFKLPLNFL